MLKWTRAFLLVACISLIFGEVAVAASAHQFDAVWREFRTRFPYHIQTIAVSPPAPDGSRAIIVSEPPPHATLERIAAATEAEDSAVMEQPIGVDGFVRDVLCVVPAMSEEQLDLIVMELHNYLFGTTYRADYLSWPLPEREPRRAGRYDLAVAHAELEQWLVHDKPLFYPVFGGQAVPLDVLLADVIDGVYFSKEPGFVIWIVPRSSDMKLDQYRSAARVWALDADLVLGAVAGESAVAIIGRERVVSTLELPPLRAEEIIRLAAADTDELAQSYERNHVLAGRYDNRHDWAPIYLSDLLIDTEYGSLLCLTDQLLKSWSENGTISYANFKYPSPPVPWPWPKPLMRHLGVNELTYNWNTQGIGYTVEHADHAVFGIGRTGALAVSYIPGSGSAFTTYSEQDTIIMKCEDKGYSFFSDTGDPNLARVVQYATLYQIFRAFGITAEPKAVTSLTQGHAILQEEIEKALQTLLTADDEFITERVFRFAHIDTALVFDSTNSEESTIEAAIALRYMLSVGELISTLEAVDQVDPDHGIHDFAGVLSTGRIAGDQAEQIALQLAVLSSMDSTAIEEYVLRSENRGLLHFLLLQGIREDPIYGAAIQSVSNIADVRLRYSKACTSRESGWIRTPSIVVSQPDEPEIGIGGHNVNSRVLRVRPNARLSPGRPQLVETADGVILEANPAELLNADISRVSRLVERSVGGLPEPRQVASILSKPRIPRTKLSALFDGRPPVKPPNMDRGTLSLGTRRSGPTTPLPVSRRVLLENAHSGNRVIVEADGPVLRVFDNHPSGVAITESRANLAFSIADRIRMRPTSLNVVEVYAKDVSPAEMQELMRSVRINLGTTREVRSAGIGIADEGGPVRSAAEVLHQYDFSAIKLGKETIERIPGPNQTMMTRLTFDLELPEQLEPLTKTMKVRVSLRKFSDRVLSKLRSILNRQRRTTPDNTSLLMELRRDLMNADESVDVIEIELPDIIIVNNTKECGGHEQHGEETDSAFGLCHPFGLAA